MILLFVVHEYKEIGTFRCNVVSNNTYFIVFVEVCRVETEAATTRPH